MGGSLSNSFVFSDVERCIVDQLEYHELILKGITQLIDTRTYVLYNVIGDAD